MRSKWGRKQKGLRLWAGRGLLFVASPRRIYSSCTVMYSTGALRCSLLQAAEVRAPDFRANFNATAVPSILLSPETILLTINRLFGYKPVKLTVCVTVLPQHYWALSKSTTKRFAPADDCRQPWLRATPLAGLRLVGGRKATAPAR